MKNKKLIKRIAVASLACFLAIPTINTVPTQAKTLVTVEMLQQEIKENEEALKTCEEQDKQNYLISIQDLKDTIKEIQEGKIIYRMTVEESKQLDAERLQQQTEQAAQKAAEQAEKDRMANTVYQIPVGVDNVYDFVPHFDGTDITSCENHKYERSDIPGVVFTLRCGLIPSTGKYGITDLDPHFTISDFKSYRIKRYKDATSKEIEYCYVKTFTYNYISPFDGFGSLSSGQWQASVGEDPRLLTYTGGSAKINKGNNSFRVHYFWKQTDESGKIIFGGDGYVSSMNAFSAEAVEKAAKDLHVRQSLTDNTEDELSHNYATAEKRIENWDAQGIDPIIEVTPYYGG